MLRPISVSELSRYICNFFEAEEMLHQVKVFGEVSGLQFVRGNLYFNLKDENSLLPCIMFGVTSLGIKEGDQILATGTPKYYAKGGKLNFYVNAVSPYGSGLLYNRFIELKNKLELEGVFGKKYKKSLPSNIQTIGVITSKTGAVLHDIETVSHRRNPTLNIVVYPSKVQGEGADDEIISGLEYFDKRPDIDVIIIARGGGSLEDLQPFNSERLARKIIEINKMVISAVGHETDFTICDFASSMRCATPSEAGEIVSKNIIESTSQVRELISKAYIIICNKLDEKYSMIDGKLLSMNMLYSKLYDNKANELKLNLIKLKNLDLFKNKEHSIDMLSNKLNLLNPISVLDRGYARISTMKGVAKSIDDMNVGDMLKIEIRGGQALAQVQEKERK